MASTVRPRGRSGMNVLASARIAVRALRVNKLRSALTMLGIVIGVGAVITMIASVRARRRGWRSRSRASAPTHHRPARARRPRAACAWAPARQLTITEDDA